MSEIFTTHKYALPLHIRAFVYLIYVVSASSSPNYAHPVKIARGTLLNFFI